MSGQCVLRFVTWQYIWSLNLMRTDFEPEGKSDEERARAGAGLQSPSNGHLHLARACLLALAPGV